MEKNITTLLTTEDSCNPQSSVQEFNVWDFGLAVDTVRLQPEDSAPHAGAPGSGLLAALDSLNALLPDPDRLRFVLGGNGENPKIVLVERATGVALGTSRVDELETLGLRLARGSLLVDDHI